MHYRYIRPKDLKGKNLDDRVGFLKNSLHLTNTEIDGLTHSTNPELYSIEKASSLIYKAARRMGMSKRHSLSLITASLVCSLVHSNNDYENSSSETAKIISYGYNFERDQLNAQFGVEVNSTSLLRKLVYERFEKKPLELNLIAAVKAWGNKINFSDNDQLRGLKLPRIGVEQALLLGYLTLGGSIVAMPVKADYSVNVNVPISERELFDSTLVPIIQKSFNMLANGDRIPKKNVVSLNSQGLYSFFKNVLGYSPLLEKRKLLDWSVIPESVMDDELSVLQKAYFVGVLAKKFRVNPYKEYFVGQMDLRHNPELLQDVSAQANRQEYLTTLISKGTRIRFGKEVVPKLFEDAFGDEYLSDYPHKGIILNPAEYTKYKLL